MHDTDILELAARITEAGLQGRPETDIVTLCAKALVGHGLPLHKLDLFIDTLHPTHEGHIYKWARDGGQATPVEYEVTEGDRLDRWRRSTFFHLLETGGTMLRRKLSPATDDEFAVFAEHRAAGITDYVAVVSRFPPAGTIGAMDCVYSAWTTDGAAGFSDEDLTAILRVKPFLAHAVKTVSVARIAETLARTYLGRDAGRRVLDGRINRGIAERMQAVLWFSDLRGYTRLSELIDSEQVLPMLNDYAEAVISAIHDEGGDVLKLIGDGVLAMFPAADTASGCAAALAATTAARDAIARLNARRSAEGRPVTDIYLGLHVGEVFYGNVGSPDRLDFTVIGPAVNEVSRIAAMCRSADQSVLLSPRFVVAYGGEGAVHDGSARAHPTEAARAVRFASVGRYALRGVGRAQHLFTLDPHG